MKEKMKLIEALVGEGFPMLSDKEYLEFFYSDKLPALPTDNLSFLSSYIHELEAKRIELRASIKIEPVVKAHPPSEKKVLQLKKYRLDLESEIKEYKEAEFYRKQSETESIKDILLYFENIRKRELFGGSAYLPAFFEWTVWRVFLAINHLVGRIEHTRNFKIDEQCLPVHHAKSGVADMIFNYDNFIVGCEVTLNTGENQWSAEGEPVPRHIANISEKAEQRVYGLFVAPSIHPQTAHQFLGQQYFMNGEFKQLDIIPLSTNQLERLLQVFEIRRFDVNELKIILQKIVELKGVSNNGLEWLTNIGNLFDNWMANPSTMSA